MVKPFIGLVLGACAASGCTRSAPRGFDAAAPEARIDAILEVAREEDRTKVRELVEALDSDDPAVRMVAIRTLERLTGETRGYEHSDPPWRRREAVARWEAWAEEAVP